MPNRKTTFDYILLFVVFPLIVLLESLPILLTIVTGILQFHVFHQQKEIRAEQTRILQELDSMLD